MNQYLALLRGINVGGKNLIKMAELKASFEAMGFQDVRTYIQSGNVLFGADATAEAGLPGQIEESLLSAFDIELRVVVRSYEEMKAVVLQAPEGFGEDPATFRYDVIFLFPPVTAGEVIESVLLKEGVDRAYPGEGVLYFSRLISRASQSRLSRVVSMPIYQDMTIRNWNTTTKLLKMMEAARA